MSEEPHAAGEVAWVRTLIPAIAEPLTELDSQRFKTSVADGYKLAYSNEVIRYAWDDIDTPVSTSTKYQTDILLSDDLPNNGGWIPRVVIECKLGSVTTHDALVYSAKASTHKHVHPYLRYGILIGNLGSKLPNRLIRHGAYFDFMVVLKGQSPTPEEMKNLNDILKSEVNASRTLHDLLHAKISHSHFSLHRPLILGPESSLQ